jgi:hypothetical protein
MEDHEQLAPTGETETLHDDMCILFPNLDSCFGRPTRNNSVLNCLRARILEDIQEETSFMVTRVF